MQPLTNTGNPYRRIALVDGNNFYASCERVFNPQWQRRPIGVLSNNDGCIVARSDELKEAGIPMGAPFYKYRTQLEAMHAVIVSSNYGLYGDMSARVMDVLSSFTPDFEVYSIDEAWLDLSGFSPAKLDSYGRHIVETTKQYTGIPVSMGIGPTKTLAKIANRIVKKRKIPGSVFNIGEAESIDAVLSSFPVSDIWGIGRRWSVKLSNHGIQTALDLKRANTQELRKRYNVVMQRIIQELNGIPCIGMDDIEPKKQIIASRSFGERVTDKNTLKEAVAFHATRAAEKLRLQGSVSQCLYVAIRTGIHNPHEKTYARSVLMHLPHPTADTRSLIKAAHKGMDKIYVSGPRYAKAGIILMDIIQKDAIEPDFFMHNEDSQSSQYLMDIIDKLNQKHGRGTIHFASEGTRKLWGMKRETKTPSYTTDWKQLPIAYAR